METQDAPPSYKDVVTHPAPPSYFKAVRNTEPSNDFEQGNYTPTHPLIKFTRYGCCLLMGAVLLFIPVVSVSIGAYYWSECPIQPMIPAYLVVVGGVSFLRNLVAVKLIFSNRAVNISASALNERNECMILLDAVLTSWFVVGSMWTIYVALYRSKDKTSEFYCNSVLFWYALVLVAGVYVTAIFSIIFFLVYRIFTEYLLSVESDCTLPPYEQIVPNNPD